MAEGSSYGSEDFEVNEHDPGPLDPVIEAPKQCIIAIGGGKGGVGKSLLAANLGIYLAQIGKRTVLLDLDLGGANLHTFVGVDRPKITLGDLFRKRVHQVEDCIVDTPVKGLGLISAEGDPLWVADPRPTTKRRLLQGIQGLTADVLILDLPAGSGFLALDFFALAQIGILLVVPEPTSTENAYRFIKSAFLRRLRMTKGLTHSEIPLSTLVEELGLSTGDKSEGGIPSPRDIYEELHSKNPEHATLIAREMLAFGPRLVINQTRSRADILLGEQMSSAGRKRLGLPIEYLGHVDSDDAVWHAVRRRRPLLTEYPESRAAKQIEKLARHLLNDSEKSNLPLLKRLDEQTLYEVLEVNPGDTVEEIRRAARRMRELYASQSMVMNGLYSPEQLAHVHERLNQAYDTLLDHEKRKKYDLSLFPEGRPHSAKSSSKQEHDYAFLAPLIPSLEENLPMPSITKDTEFSGELLRKIREAMHLDLKEIADRTKVGLHQLQFIEAESWKEMPAHVYLRGFLTEYAKCLHLDTNQVTTTYLARTSKKI